jgi:hypothetical protein
VWIDHGKVRASTDPDTTGRAWIVEFDAPRRTWTRPLAGPPSPPDDSLSNVRVFAGGLFDKFPLSTIELGGGYALVRDDSTLALTKDGTWVGWPQVTEKDVDRWSGEVRQGLPTLDPSERVWQLFGEHRLKNVPGPFVRMGSKLWFGLAGGFASGQGQFGGLVSYDTTSGQFDVVRHKFIADAAAITLFAQDDELWIGTGRFGPQKLEGMRGLVLYRPKRKEWRQFSVANSRISGDLVWDIAPDGRHLWVTTDRGVSRYDLDRHLWDSWYWHENDDGGFQLVTRRPENLAEELVK